MKKLIFVFIIAFAIPTFANEGPKIDVIPQTWDFGKLTVDDKPEHTFEVRNIGSSDLTIFNVTTSCGCTTAVISKNRLAKGESAKLKVSFEPKQAKTYGKIKGGIFIESNDPGEAIKTVSILLELDADIQLQPHTSKPVVAGAFSQAAPPPKITSQELHSRITKGEKIVILDVREKNEYLGKHIPQAVWFPKSKFDKHDLGLLKRLKKIKKESVVLTYCGAGHRSSYVAKKLREMGYDAYTLDGISFWEKENLPLIRGPKLPPGEEPAIIHLEEAYENYFLLFKDVVWVDVREKEDYKRGHIKGALGIPLSEIVARARELPKDKEIVFYCEGTWDGGICEASRSAGRILIKQGFKQGTIKVFEDGYGAWANAGYPIDKTN